MSNKNTPKSNLSNCTIDLTRNGKLGGTPKGNNGSDKVGLLSRMERCNSVGGSIKRKRMEGNHTGKADNPYNRTECSVAFVLSEAIEMTCKLAEDLNKQIGAHSNTQKNIKETAAKIVRNSEVFQRLSVKAWLEDHRYEPIEKMCIEMDTQTAEKSTSDVGTQTDPWLPDNDLLTTLGEICTLGDFSLVETKLWDDTLYKNTEIKVGNPIDTPDSTAKVVMVEPKDPDMTKSIQKIYKDKFPDLSKITGKFEIMEQLTRLKSRKGKISSRKIVKISHDGTRIDIWNKLALLRAEMKGEEQIAMHHVQSLSLETLQKMVQTIFNDTGIYVTIFTTEAFKNGSGKDSNDVGRKKTPTTLSMVISEGKKSYTEILGTVRKALSLNKNREAIRSIRSTKDGKLLLTMERDEEAMVNIGNILKGTTQLETKHLGNKGTEAVNIKGMEEGTSKEDVRDAIKEIIGIWSESYRISEIRPMRSNTTAVTVRLDSEAAKKLLKEQYIRIGLVRCSTEKWHQVRRCRRCWSYEHEAKDCKGPDRTENCYRCGESGHAAQECINDEACPICETKGHKPNSGKCPAFRNALKKVRGNNKMGNTVLAGYRRSESAWEPPERREGEDGKKEQEAETDIHEVLAQFESIARDANETLHALETRETLKDDYDMDYNSEVFLEEQIEKNDKKNEEHAGLIKEKVREIRSQSLDTSITGDEAAKLQDEP